MKESIRISDRLIGPEHPPFIVAEMSGNHNQSLGRALEIVDAAAKSGVHALKLQTYTADTITLDVEEGEFLIKDPDSLWKGQSLYKLYKKAYTPWEWHEPIFKRCRELGLIAFSTPFDETAVEFLEDLHVPAYKISSFENNHLLLIRKAASTGKPLIISTGMARISEIEEAVETAREAGCDQIILLKCTSTYPANPVDTNLMTIPHLRDLFDVEVGLSDHTLGIGVSLAAVALRATVIEKHFMLARAEGGIDSVFSLEPDEMGALVDESLRAWQALGEVFYGATAKEKSSMIFRRSLYISRDMKGEEVFNPENLRAIRPGKGISPKYYDVVMGKKINCNAKKGTPLTWDMVRG